MFGKWIFPSTIIPTHPPLEFGQKLAIPTKSQKFIRSRETPCTRAIGTPCTRDPVHMGLTYPVRTGHRGSFSHFFCFSYFCFTTIPRVLPHHSTCLLSVRLRFLLCPKVFRLLRCNLVTSSPPIIDSDNTLTSTRSSSTVSKDGNLDDAFVLPCH